MKPYDDYRKDLENGYIPHEGQMRFRCGQCGCPVFKTYPQSMPLGGKAWTYEYHCVNCGQMMGLTRLGDEE